MVNYVVHPFETAEDVLLLWRIFSLRSLPGSTLQVCSFPLLSSLLLPSPSSLEVLHDLTVMM